MQVYKYVVHQVAQAYGKTATFMPKPIKTDNGSGMHTHISIWNGGKPLFAGNGYAGLSDMCLYFIGGMIKHAKSLNAFTNPTTNSYKRLVPGYEAPVLLAYSARNRSASCRIPYGAGSKAKRVEFRFPDAMANPYLCYAALVQAGLDGIKNKIHPGEAMDKNLYDLPRPNSPKCRQSAVRCAKRWTSWQPIMITCSRAACSPRTRSKPISSSSGPKLCAGKPRPRRSSSTCIIAPDFFRRYVFRKRRPGNRAPFSLGGSSQRDWVGLLSEVGRNRAIVANAVVAKPAKRAALCVRRLHRCQDLVQQRSEGVLLFVGQRGQEGPDGGKTPEQQLLAKHFAQPCQVKRDGALVASLAALDQAVRYQPIHQSHGSGVREAQNAPQLVVGRAKADTPMTTMAAGVLQRGSGSRARRSRSGLRQQARRRRADWWFGPTSGEPYVHTAHFST